MRIRPLGKRVVVKLNTRIGKKTKKTDGGINIPESAEQLQAVGRIAEIGPECSLRRGDLVLFTKYGGADVDVDGVPMKIFEEKEIMGVINAN